MAIATHSAAVLGKTVRTFFVKLSQAVTNPAPCWEEYLRQTR